MRQERTCVSVKKMNPARMVTSHMPFERIADRGIQCGDERGGQVDDVRGLAGCADASHADMA